MLKKTKLDLLFQRIYEDNVSGKISDERFEMLSETYEKEQAELKSIIENLSAEISETEEQSDNVERFISKVHKYFDLQELTPSVLNDMVKRVYVHAPQTIDGKRTQEIDIVYDLVGILPLSLFNNEKVTPASNAGFFINGCNPRGASKRLKGVRRSDRANITCCP